MLQSDVFGATVKTGPNSHQDESPVKFKEVLEGVLSFIFAGI